MSYCEANDLAVGYNSPLLEHIKFAAERGQILTLIGPNGAGKSTLMKTQQNACRAACAAGRDRFARWAVPFGIRTECPRAQNGADGAAHEPHRAHDLL